MHRKGILFGLLLASGAVFAVDGMDGMSEEGAADMGVGADADVGAAQPLSFETIDVDRNQAISQEEAAGYPGLVENWTQYDVDESGDLDQAEFAAFTEELGTMQPGGDTGVMEQPDTGIDTEGQDLGGDTGLDEGTGIGGDTGADTGM